MIENPKLRIGSKIQFQSNTYFQKQTVFNGSFLPEKIVDPKVVSRVLTHFSAVANVMLGAVLDVADSYMIDAIELLKKNNKYRFAVKYRGNTARQKFEYIRRYLYQNVRGRESLYMDMLDKVQDDIKTDMQKLYYPILGLLDKLKIKDSDIKAQIEMVWMVLHLGCRLYASIVDGSTQMSGVDTKSFWKPYDPHGVFGQWEILCELVCGYDQETNMAIATDKNIGLAFDIILQRLVNPTYVEKRCQEVLDEHPEFDEEVQMAIRDQEEDKMADKLAEERKKTAERLRKKGQVVRQFKISAR